MQRRSESSELNAKHHIGTVRVERRQAELEQTDQSLQIVIRTAIVAAEREELLSSPVFYSTEQPPLKFDLDGKVIVHPRVVLGDSRARTSYNTSKCQPKEARGGAEAKEERGPGIEGQVIS